MRGSSKHRNQSRGFERSALLNAVAFQDHFIRSHKLDLSVPGAKGKSRPRPPKPKKHQTQPWTCERCTFYNEHGGMECLACGCEHTAAKPQRTLAQVLGLVPGPPKPLSSHEWQDVERASNARGDSDQPCPICLEPFKMKEQVLLSCSHCFHKHCLDNVERFARMKERSCPICRRKDYEKKRLHQGKRAFKRQCVIKIQAWWRGVVLHNSFKATMAAIYEAGGGHPLTRNKYFESKFRKSALALESEMNARGDALDSLFAELDKSVAQARSIFDCHPKLQSVPTAMAYEEYPLEGAAAVNTEEEDKKVDWESVVSRAINRDDFSCPICFGEMDENASKEEKKSNEMPAFHHVALLSCGHLFHDNCIAAYERYSCEEQHRCPLCRADYARRTFVAPPHASTKPIGPAPSRPLPTSARSMSTDSAEATLPRRASEPKTAMTREAEVDMDMDLSDVLNILANATSSISKRTKGRISGPPR